jgi:hypothetical protein
MLLGGAGLAFLATVRLCATAEVSPLLLCGTVAATLLLVGAHPLGLVYSGFLTAALLVHDGLHRQVRLRVYGAVIAGWSVLLFSREALRNSAAVGKPHFWTVRPGLRDLRMIYIQNTHFLQTLLLVGGVVLLLALMVRWQTLPADSGGTGGKTAWS